MTDLYVGIERAIEAGSEVGDRNNDNIRKHHCPEVIVPEIVDLYEELVPGRSQLEDLSEYNFGATTWVARNQVKITKTTGRREAGFRDALAEGVPYSSSSEQLLQFYRQICVVGEEIRVKVDSATALPCN